MNKLLSLILFLILSVAAHAEDKAIIVFDASGSMWAQLEGKTKIAIAKKTLSDVVSNWDDSKQLGLLAYGHRRKGDCKDIETLVPVGKINKAAMISKVNKINPKGKTPISASIRMAADELKFTEDNATVILISDGKETCNADPCATAAELEKLGINFTAHVIGFGVDKKTSEQLKCIADNTGGKFFNADNAKQLNEALEKVVEQPKALTIKAVDDDGNTLHKTIEWKLINQDSEEVLALTGSGAGKEITIASKDPNAKSITDKTIAIGKWLVSGSTGIFSGETSVDISGDANQLVKVTMKKQLPKVTIKAADEAITGTELELAWDAPKDLEGLINLQMADEKPIYHANPLFHTKDKTEATMRLPSVAGDYVLRFYDKRERKTALAEHPITLKAAEIVINAPDEAGTGTEIDLSWTAPKDAEAKINLELVGEKPKFHTNPHLYIKGKKEATLRMPSEAGDYVLRWYNQSDRKVVVEKPIKLVEVKIVIIAPDEVGTGTEIDLSWEAPKTAEAKINLEAVGEKPKFHASTYLYTKGKKEASLRMPSEAGEYILRWYNLSDRKIASERPIKLVEEQITLSAPDEAGAGTEIDISWIAPKTAEAKINLEAVGEKPKFHSTSYLYTKKKTTATLRTPSEEGDYILRYYNLSDRKVIAERPIKLIAQSITLSAPETATAGTEVEISWDAPKGLEAYINIQPSEDKANYNARPYFYTKKKQSEYMRMPSSEGDYTLRWYNRKDRKVLAERPIKLTAAEVSITAPDEAIAGTEIEISWQAPKGLNSFINVQLTDEKPNYNAKAYIYTKKKTSDYLRLPSTVGEYILRWYNRNDRKMLAERPIKLVEPEITITVPDEIKADSEVEISWQAPKSLNSFINIQKAGEKPNYNAKKYIYTNKKSSDYLKMPAEPGEYVLRWYNRNDRKVIAEKKITIN